MESPPECPLGHPITSFLRWEEASTVAPKLGESFFVGAVTVEMCRDPQ